MSKVQLQDLESKNVYPVTNADYVEGFEDKFTELNKDDVELNEQQQKDINELKENKADKTWVTEQIGNAITGGEIDLSSYATKSWVEEQGFLKEHQNLEGYAKSSEVTEQINQATNDMATQTWVEEQLKDFKPGGGDSSYDDIELKQWIDETYLKKDEINLDNYVTTQYLEQQNYLTDTDISDMATKTFVNSVKTSLVNGASVDYSTFGDIEYQLSKKLDSSLLDNYPTKDEVTQQILEITTEGKIDLTGYATEVWVKGLGYLQSNMLIPITLEDYNKLGDNIDREAWYFIVDSDDALFDRINEMYDSLSEVKNFINNFPIDNHCYGIVNRLPKYLNISGLDQANSDTSNDENPETID